MLRRSASRVLCCDEVPLPELAERFGTPLYVYSASTIRERVRAFQQAFRKVPHTVCYSVKANSNLGILRLLAGMGCGFDVVSGGELERVLAVDRRAAKQGCVFGRGQDARRNAGGAESRHLAVQCGERIGMWTLAECAAQLNADGAIAFRVNPDVPAETHPYISTGLHKHKFGVPIGEARELIREGVGHAVS